MIHQIIALYSLIQPELITHQSKKKIRFKEKRLSDNRCGEAIEAAWRQSFGPHLDNEVLNKVKQCGKDLEWWNRNCFGNVCRELEKKKKKKTDVASSQD